jgi:hypothetical protein
MVGTTRSRVSFFMNRFRKLGWIDYNGRIRVNKKLLNAVLRDQWPEAKRIETQACRSSVQPGMYCKTNQENWSGTQSCNSICE